MANRGFISPPHRLLPGFSPLGGHRSVGGVSPGNSRASPPDFSYDAFPRAGSGNVTAGGAGGRDGGPAYGSTSRTPSTAANSALSLGYPGVAEFPYGLSGVQMPTYNFGSELYNYVSNGFPRKSRMCTFCNKVFTRSTTRRYHERRCPLLRASNSLAKSEENSAAAAAALKEQQQQQQQRHKEAASRISASLPSPSAGSRGLNGMVHTPGREREKERDNGHLLNGNLGLLGGRHTPPQLRQPTAPERSSTPPPASLHPAYPATFPPSAASALASTPSRAAAAAAAYSYAQTYGSHFYNSISAAALASLDQNSNKSKKDERHSDGSAASPWSSSALSPTSRPWDQREHHHHGSHHQQEQHHHSQSKLTPTTASSLALGDKDGDFPGKSSLANSIMSSLGVDLTSRYCADFSLRSQPAVFPTSHNRGPAPVSPNSPEPGETRSSSSHERRCSPSPSDGHGSALTNCMSSRQNGSGWSSPPSGAGDRSEVKEERLSYPHHYGIGFQDKIQTSNISGARLKTTSPPLNSWNSKASFEDPASKSPKDPPQFMAVRPLDEDEEEDEEDEEEDEEEMEEDEEQFNETGSAGSRADSLMDKSGKASQDFSSLAGRSHARSSSYNPLVCNICKKSFPDTLARQAHEALHSQTKAFACAICSRSFHCAYSLRIHFLRHHSAGGPYSCKYCPLKFDGALALKAHLVTQHILSKQEACSLKYFSLLEEPTGSPRSLSSGGRLSIGSHRSALSDSERDTKIQENGGFRGRTSPSQRRSAESLPDILSCHEDYDTTKTLHDRMRQRQALEPPNDHTECRLEENGKVRDELGPRSRVLPLTNGSMSLSSAHDVDVKPDKEEETEVCKVCNKAFAKSFIRYHERAHADQKPYECSICHKRFGYKNNMKSHMKLHQGLKPYQCQICGARFTRGSTLRRHGRRHNISRNSMLEYVLYDHSAGPTRAVGVTSKTGTATSAPTAAAAAASQHAVAVASSLYAQQMASRISPSEQSLIPGTGPAPQLGFPPALSRQNSAGGERYAQSTGVARRSSPPQSSPQGLSSPRATGNHHLTTQAMAGPMVGGLAAVAAANLFGYPAAAAPHLYQLYASANPLMNYPHGYASGPHPHHNSQAASAVQSDALNLSLGKRKSPFQEEEEQGGFVSKAARRVSDSSGGHSGLEDGGLHGRGNGSRNTEPPIHTRPDAIKIETDDRREPDDVARAASSNPFTPVYSPKKESPPLKKENEPDYLKNDQREHHLHNHQHHHHHHPHHRDYNHHHHHHEGSHIKPGNDAHDLKISTEDFAAQVNFCCPSPLVQSSTGHTHLHRSSSTTGSPPVGSTSSFTSPHANSTTTAAGSTTENVMARASPSGHVSHPNSPDNTTTTTTSPIPSPTAESDGSGVIALHGDAVDAHEDGNGKLNLKKGLNNPLHELLLSLLTAGRMFRCSFCEIYFAEYAMFRLHQKYHQCDLDRPFVCSVCGEDCKDKTYFTVHLSEHLGLGKKQALT